MAATGITVVSGKVNAAEKSIKNVFIHHVFFWLTDPENQDARKEFRNGLERLIPIPLIKSSHIGTPVQSERDVVDDSFTYSYMAFFASKEDQNAYQTHPVHLKFVEDCQHLWKKVIVYDAMD